MRKKERETERKKETEINRFEIERKKERKKERKSRIYR